MNTFTNTEADQYSAFLSILEQEAPAHEEESAPEIQEPSFAPQEFEEEDEYEHYDDEDGFPGGEEESDSEEAEEEEDFEESEEEEYEEGEESEDGVIDVDFDTLITLPNGVEITIEDLHKGFKSNEDVIKLQEELEEEKATFTELKQSAEKRIALSKLEAERVLEEFRGFDWQKLARENPEEFANTKLFVEKYAERKNEIEAEYARIEQEKEAAKAAELKVSAKACLEKLTQDIPAWNQSLYSEILAHGVEELGIEKDFLLSCTDPGVIKALYGSLRMKKGADSVKAKVTKKVKAPVKTAKSTKKEVKVTKKPSSSYNPTNEDSEFSFFKSTIMGGK